jgi:uncharacterized protein
MVSPPPQVATLAPQSQREPILDVLRGFAILGILLVNIHFMRGTQWMGAGDTGPSADSGTAGDLAQFLIGWLASGKFLSSLALLFGIGAALMHARAIAAGRSPRLLLLRRYVILMAFGLAHMLLLYPGDVLFVYGAAGLMLLAFVNLHPRALALWAIALLSGYALAVVRLAGLYSYTPAAQLAGESGAPAHDPFDDLRTEAIAAFTQGSYGDIVSVHAWQALTLQAYQFSALPWILALFVLGYALGRTGVLDDLPAHRALWRRGACIGLIAGLPANVAVGYGGALGNFAGAAEPGASGLLTAATLGQAIGTPLLAVGYLCALTLYCLRRGPIRRLAAVGRMALTAYLLQSALALAIITAFQCYDRLSSVSALLLVAGVWAVLLVACPLWLRRFRLGPAEWLWRSLTYGRWQPMRIGAGVQ